MILAVFSTIAKVVIFLPCPASEQERKINRKTGCRHNGIVYGVMDNSMETTRSTRMRFSIFTSP